MRRINIEIQKPNHLKNAFHKIYNRFENLMFSIIQKLPDRLIPNFLLEWLDKYTTKRINQLKQQNIKHTWKNIYLESALEEISNRQNK